MGTDRLGSSHSKLSHARGRNGCYLFTCTPPDCMWDQELAKATARARNGALTHPPTPRRRHGVRNARLAECDRARERTPRRRLPPACGFARHITRPPPPTLAAARSSPVGRPNRSLAADTARGAVMGGAKVRRNEVTQRHLEHLRWRIATLRAISAEFGAECSGDVDRLISDLVRLEQQTANKTRE